MGGCGWYGYGDNRKQMYCKFPKYAREYFLDFPEYRRMEGSVKSPAPKPPSSGVCEVPKSARAGPEVKSPNPSGNTGCRDADDCHGDSVYCYPGHNGQPNFCKKGDGVGSVCTDDESCG